jgi:hypothetical protein
VNTLLCFICISLLELHIYRRPAPATNLLQAHTKRLAVFFGEDGQLQRESSDSSLDEFCKTLILPFGP